MTTVAVPTRRTAFEIHGVRFAFASDMREVASLVGSTYDAVRSIADGGFNFTVTLRRGRAGTAQLTDSATGETVSVSEASAIPVTLHRIAQLLVAALTASDLLLVHAAAVVRRGEALIVSGPRGSGKTTIALGLARRGLALLSDEIAVLPRVEPRVLAYRRSLHVRPGTPELIAELEPVRKRPPADLGGGNTWSVTPRELEAMMPSGVATSGRLRSVLILDPAGPGDHPAELTGLPRGVAAVELAHAAPAAAVQLNQVLATLGRHLATARCARLTMGRLDDALGLITAWLDAG